MLLYIHIKSIVHQLALSQHESIPRQDRNIINDFISLGGIIII